MRVRERYDVQPFQADVDFGETPSCKFISDISNTFDVTTALAVDSASVYEQQLGVEHRSFGVHIYYLIRSSRTPCGKFYYYSPFIGD